MKPLKLSLNKNELVEYLYRHLNIFFPDKTTDKQVLYKLVEISLLRLEYCFKNIIVKHYQDNNNTLFNHLHGDQYCMFLYFMSNEAYLSNKEEYYLKTSLLNKYLNSIDLFGHIEMPEIFLLVHPIGTILGRAKYSNYLIVYQNVTVGGKHDGISQVQYPSFNEFTALLSNVSIIGDAHLGEKSILAANTKLIGGRYTSNSIIIGNYPDITEKKANDSFFNHFFK